MTIIVSPKWQLTQLCGCDIQFC